MIYLLFVRESRVLPRANEVRPNSVVRRITILRSGIICVFNIILSSRIGNGGSPCDTSPTKLKINIILSHSDDRVTVGIHCVLTDAYNFNKRGVQK